MSSIFSLIASLSNPSPEIALEVLLDATKRTRVGGGKNNLWAEGDLGAGVFAAVLTESEKVGGLVLGEHFSHRTRKVTRVVPVLLYIYS